MNSFQKEVVDRIIDIPNNQELRDAASCFMRASTLPKYCYNFTWLDRPIIQYPQDIVASGF